MNMYYLYKKKNHIIRNHLAEYLQETAQVIYNNVCLLSQNQQTKMSNSNYFKFESLVLHT